MPLNVSALLCVDKCTKALCVYSSMGSLDHCRLQPVNPKDKLRCMNHTCSQCSAKINWLLLVISDFLLVITISHYVQSQILHFLNLLTVPCLSNLGR